MAKPNIQKRARIQDTDTDERINKNERVTKFKHEPQSTLVSSNALNTNTHGNLSATAATGESKNKSPGDQQFVLHSIELPECIIHHILEWADLGNLSGKIYQSPHDSRLCPARLWNSFYNGSLPPEMEKHAISHNANNLMTIRAHYLAQVPDKEFEYRRYYVSDASAKDEKSFKEETSVVMCKGSGWWEYVMLLYGIKFDIKYTSQKEAAFWSKLSTIVGSLETFFLNMYGRSEIATFVESLPDHVVEWNIDDDESSEDGSSDEYLSDSDPDTVPDWWLDDHEWYG
jgi:hypothetical protein